MKMQFLSTVLLGFVLAAASAYAAESNPALHTEAQHMAHQNMQESTIPRLPGQDAFGAIQEIVQMLEADPNTDWSKVNIENLRQHLIDMNEVVLHSDVKSAEVPAGLTMEITGKDRTERAIKSMVMPQSGLLNQMPLWTVQAEEIPGGVRLTVKAKHPNDTKTIAKIRGLGFAGLLVQGNYHPVHHLAMAKGEWKHQH
jgi:hypothetical protein